MNILHVASEVAPLHPASAVGDAALALPRALGRQPGVQAQLVSARSGAVQPDAHGLARRLRQIAVPLGEQVYQVEVWEGRLYGQLPVYLIEHPLLSAPAGADAGGHLRAGLLGQAALRVAQEFSLHPDVIHAHDGQAALALYYARRGEVLKRRPATVMTIHNLSELGLFPLEQAGQIDVGADCLSPEGIEFFGQGSLLKAGLLFADRITTVSPRYAREIQTAEHGCGLQGLLEQLSGRLSGILNGADYERWSPAADPYTAARYGDREALEEPRSFSATVAGKARCKAELQRELGLLPRPRAPLSAIISQPGLTEEGGADVLLQALEQDELWRGEAQCVVLGCGEPAVAERLLKLQRRHHGRMAVRADLDEPLAHRALAGADIYVLPSRFEPCGAGPMHALRYGTIPVLRAVGGLDDIVVDYDPRSRSGTGFKFAAYDARALSHAWQRAILAHEGGDEAWHALQRRAMRVDLSWAAAARSYLSVYQLALREAQARS